MKKRRDGAKVASALEKVRAAAASDQNTMPPLVEAVEAHATLGELVGALKQVYGEYKEPVRFS